MIVGGTEILKVSAEPSSAVLDANLGVLRREGSTITARIAASPDVPIELEVAEDGSPTGVWRGRRLASARRPADEVDRLLDGVRVEDVGIVAIAGGWEPDPDAPDESPGGVEAVAREIRITILHEVGHHYGLSEEDLDRLGYA